MYPTYHELPGKLKNRNSAFNTIVHRKDISINKLIGRECLHLACFGLKHRRIRTICGSTDYTKELPGSVAYH